MSASWSDMLNGVRDSSGYCDLRIKLADKINNPAVICPHPSKIYQALQETPLSDVRVVILGQEPYNIPGLATGLAFGIDAALYPRPLALRNIIKELKSDLSIDVGSLAGSLVGWARQGVLLLNTSLTVEGGRPHSHGDLGWDVIVDAIIKAVDAKESKAVFMLWGADAINKRRFIGYNHLVLQAAPPTSRSFFGCRHFSQANCFFVSKGLSPINWERIE